MDVERAFAEAKRKDAIQRKWEARQRYRKKREVGRRVRAMMAPEWIRVKELSARAELPSATMKDSLEYLTAYNEAQRKESHFLREEEATLGDSMKRFLLVVERRGFVKCPSCGEQYSKLRESGECIECDPYEQPQTKLRTVDQVQDILQIATE